MQKYKQDFIQFCIQNNVIRFGEFILKSGRKSPYFFNAGLFNTGQNISALGGFYAQAIQASKIEFDILFGPAYKGIPLVVSAVIALTEKYKINKPFAFNRKLAKDHGEGGNLVGAPLKGKVLIIDDVITAGTATRESLEIINQNQAQAVGIVVALDRQEKGQGELSAIQEIEQKHNMKAFSIITLQDLISYVKQSSSLAPYLDAIRAYQEDYGVE